MGAMGDETEHSKRNVLPFRTKAHALITPGSNQKFDPETVLLGVAELLLDLAKEQLTIAKTATAIILENAEFGDILKQQGADFDSRERALETCRNTQADFADRSAALWIAEQILALVREGSRDTADRLRQIVEIGLENE
jgi:hypothetical protein